MLQVKNLFKAQRDDPARVGVTPDDLELGSGGFSATETSDTRAMAIEGALKSGLRVACYVTSRV